MRITVLGGGSWGTALASMLAGKGCTVTMFVRGEEQARNITEKHENARYLPGIPLSPSLKATSSPEKALEGAEICVLAIPCQSMRAALTELAPHVPEKAIPVCVSKGIETDTLCTMHQVVKDTLPANAPNYTILSGPSFAKEVAVKKPTTVAMASANPANLELLRETFSTSYFRVYSSADVLGLELGGAMKNVMAIAAGMCDGLELGHNARAGLITRGLAEMCRLGQAMGASGTAFTGLSGIGDLVLTCTGDLSRNRTVGMRLGKGESLEQITASMNQVAEGVKTTYALCALGRKHNVEIPISEAVQKCLLHNVNAAEMVKDLMSRALRDE